MSYKKLKLKWFRENSLTVEKDDFYLRSCPRDTITSIRFSDVENIEHDPEYVSCSSWDGTVKIWSTKPEIATQSDDCIKVLLNLENDIPILSHCWTSTDPYMITAGAHGCIDLWDLTNGAISLTTQAHTKAVSDVYFDKTNKLSLSAGWDGHITFCSNLVPNPCLDINMEPLRIWSCSYVDPLLVCATSDNNMYVFNIHNVLRGNLHPELKCTNSIGYQIRSVEVSPTANWFTYSTIAGRFGIKFIDWNNLTDAHPLNTEVACHYKNVSGSDYELYSVHQTCINSKYGTIMTCGGDGKYTFCTDTTLIKDTPGCKLPITACRWSLNANYAAFAFGYDWTRGVAGAGDCPVGMFVHKCKPYEVKI